MSCAYKNIFGKVGEGIHSYRIGNIAVLDVLVVCLFAYLINFFCFPRYNYGIVLFVFFIIGIFAHRVFCARTTVDKFIFP